MSSPSPRTPIFRIRELVGRRRGDRAVTSPESLTVSRVWGETEFLRSELDRARGLLAERERQINQLVGRMNALLGTGATPPAASGEPPAPLPLTRSRHLALLGIDPLSRRELKGERTKIYRAVELAAVEAEAASIKSALKLMWSYARGRTSINRRYRLMRAVLSRSPLFDALYYVSRYPDVAQSGVAPLDHYLLHGFNEGREPHPLFNPAYYRSTVPPELANQIDEPVFHFLTAPVHERGEPHALFSGIYYLTMNADVASSCVNPLEHFLLVGGDEAINCHPLFDIDYYLSQLTPEEIGSTNPVIHYLSSGGRSHKPHRLFDPEFYLHSYPDISLQNVNPLLHYLRFGADEGRDPSPDFDTKFYRERYPETCGAGVSALEHYLLIGVTERRSVARFRPSAEILEAWHEACTLDPTIRLKGFQHIVQAPVNRIGHSPIGDTFDWVARQLPERVTHLFFLPWLKRGGAELEASQLVRAVARADSRNRVAVVVADFDCYDAADWFQNDACIVRLPDAPFPLSEADRVEVLKLIILHSRPNIVHVVNSRAAWEALKRYGKPLSSVCSMYGSFFCHDYSADGFVDDYVARYFLDVLPHLSGAFVDNRAFVDDLAAEFGLTEEAKKKVRAVYFPAPEAARGAQLEPSARPLHGALRVLWAGRLDRQKRPDILLRIAQVASWAEFSVYGSSNIDGTPVQSGLSRLPNVSMRGPYHSFAELDPRSYDCLLYTSSWDGLPNVLLEASSHGLPVVAPPVGGITELITETTGYVVASDEDVAGYIAALDAIRKDPDAALLRGEAARALVTSRHSFDAFTASLESVPGYLRPEGSGSAVDGGSR